jgi:hypothetical protein
MLTIQQRHDQRQENIDRRMLIKTVAFAVMGFMIVTALTDIRKSLHDDMTKLTSKLANIDGHLSKIVTKMDNGDKIIRDSLTQVVSALEKIQAKNSISNG